MTFRTSLRLALVASALAALAACGGATSTTPDAASPDVGTSVDAATEQDAASEDAEVSSDGGETLDAVSTSDAGCSRPDAAMGSSDVQCMATPPVFPTFDRSCCDVSDCAVARHQIDCCGSFTQTGISASAQGAFQTAETQCQSQYPRCRCASRPDVADDESTTTSSADVASVRCLDHVCVTTFAL